MTTGRYHRGADRFPADETWPALYTGLAPHIALGERLRHTTPEVLPLLTGQRISQLWLELQVVLNGCTTDACVDPLLPGLSDADLCRPGDYTLTHTLAAAVRAHGADGFIIPSCTKFRGGNLIVFPDLLHAASIIRVVNSEDPDLFVDRTEITATDDHSSG